MADRFLAAAIPGLIIGSLALNLVDDVRPWAQGMMSIAAGTLALYDYGRRGGMAKEVKRSASAMASAAASWAAFAVIAISALASTAVAPHFRFAVATLGLIVALTGAGLRSGFVSRADGRVVRGEGPEAVLVVCAALGAGVAAFDGIESERTALLAAAAVLVAVGHMLRPRAATGSGQR